MVKTRYCLMNYTIQCTDVTTGKVGCFLFDQAHWQRTGEFKAISPVMPGLTEFYAWCHENGNPQRGQYIARDVIEQPLPFTLGPHGGRSYHEQTQLGDRYAAHRDPKKMLP